MHSQITDGQNNQQQQQQQFDVDVDMNSFSMLNHHHQESITSSGGVTVLKQVKENIQQADNHKNVTKFRTNNANNLNIQNQQQQQSVIQSQEIALKNEDAGFFLTGVNVNGMQQEDDEEDVNPLIQESKIEQIQEKSEDIDDSVIDNYEIISVIDSNKALSNDNCVVISEKQQTITHLTCNSSITFRVDSLVSQYEQVKRLSSRFAKQFADQQRTDKLILNITDQHDSSNIGGFNISNFKMRYLNEFIGDIITDYEQSFIGCFSKQLILYLQQQNLQKQMELYMSVTKFEGDSGFSLVQGDDQEELQDDVIDYNQIYNSQVRQSQNIRETSANKSNKKANDDKYLLMSKSPNNERDLSQDNQRQFSNDKKQKTAKTPASTTTLPEYKKITDMPEIYSAFTQANLRHRVLKRKTSDKISMDSTTIQTLEEVKDDIVLIQFKLLSKETEKTLNTFSFLNVPLSKMGDINLQNLHDILIKIKQPTVSKTKEYIPYNKSILTRILAPIIHKGNMTIITHYSKKAILNHLNAPNHTGLANGLYLFIDKIYQEKRFKKKKLNNSEALKLLQKKFAKEVKEIYQVIGNFRDGIQSFETYTQQQAQTTGISNSKIQSFTLFHQILHFLALKEDIQINGGPLANTKFITEEEIQKVIFDKQYLKYLRKKIREELGGSSSNQQGLQSKLTKLQQVQYDCIKSELKEDYEKKVQSLKQKLNRKAMRDPSLLLFSQLTQDQNQKKNNTTPHAAGSNLNHSFTGGASAGRNAQQTFTMKQRYISQGMKEKKISALSEKVTNEKDRFYEFYLKSAQKAIDIMRQQQQLAGLKANSVKNFDSIPRNDFDITNSNLQQQHQNNIIAQNQSDLHSQSSLMETKNAQNISNNPPQFKQSLNSGLKITQPLRSSSSRREERKPYRNNNLQEVMNHDSLDGINNNHSKLQPLFTRDVPEINNNNYGLERIEERIKMSKINDTLQNNNNTTAYSNMDRKTSASTYSRGGISSQQRKFRQPPQIIQSQVNQKQVIEQSLPKPNSELGKVKEFLPLRAQGKLKALNNINQDSTLPNGILDQQSCKENTRFAQNTANMFNSNNVLYEQRDMKRKPQTAQRQQRVRANNMNNNYGGYSETTTQNQKKFMHQRTNSMSKPLLLKKDSSNFTGTVGISDMLNNNNNINTNNYMTNPTNPVNEYNGDDNQPLFNQNQ